MLGDTRDGIAAELGDVEPDWTLSAPRGPPGRPHRRRGGRRLGRRGRPGLDPGPLGRRRRRGLAPLGPPLVEVVLDQLPDGIHDWELAADVSHVRMAQLGAELGLPASEVNHVYSVDAATVETLAASRPERSGPPPTPTSRRIRPLHDQEFPASYADRRPPGSRASRRQVPGRRRHGRAAAPRLRRRPGPARRRGLPRLHRRRGRRPRPGHRTRPDGRRLPPGDRRVHDRQAAPHRPGPPRPRPPPLRVPRLPRSLSIVGYRHKSG